MNESRAISRLGSKIFYWVQGPDDGHVIIFSHGATLDHNSFKDQITVFTEMGYRVITWDMRGHGQSTPIGTDISIEVLADDLLAIIDDIGIKKATLVGHSFGGYVVQLFTYKHPERVKNLVVIGCTNLAQKSRLVNKFLYRITPRMLKRMDLNSFRYRTLEDLSIKEDVKSYAAKAMEYISKEDFIKITLAGVEALWLESGIPEDYRIPVPFLLLHGDSDDANGKVFHKQSPKWASQEPNCHYEIIPEAGHTAHMDNPVAFNRVLDDFLRETDI